MGPGEDSTSVLSPCEHQLTEESSHFRDSPRNQLETGLLFFLGELLLLRTTDSSACANIDNVM